MALTTEFQRIGTSTYTVTGSNELRLYAKYNYQNIQGNYSNVTMQLRTIALTGSYYSSGNTSNLNCYGDRGTKYYNIGTVNTSSEKIIGTWDFDLGHAENGTLSGSASASANVYGNITPSVSGSFELPTIPREASITAYTANAIDEHTIRVGWSANATINAVQYSLNDSSWVNASGSTFDITNLNENTQYSVKIRVRRADSGMWTTSGYLYPKTYSYPTITGVSVQNLVIGTAQTLIIDNPLNRTFTLKMNKDSADGTLLYQNEINGITTTFTPNSNTLYNTIPNSTEGNCVYSIVYSGATKSTSAYKYLVNVNESKPIFNDFAYSTNLQTLTGNTNTIVNGKTSTTITISTSNKAVAKNGASISRYSITLNNLETQDAKLINYSSNSDVATTINQCTSDIIRVTAIDSRGLETSVTKTVPYFKNYFIPSFVSYSVEREDGVEEDVYLDLKLNFWNHSFGDKTNKINKLEFRAKETSSSEFGNWVELNAGALVINNEQASLDNYQIFLDGISQGFTIGVSYDIQLRVTDGITNYDLSSATSDSFRLTDGKIAFSILKDSNGDYHIGINGMPDLDYTLKVYGNIA